MRQKIRSTTVICVRRDNKVVMAVLLLVIGVVMIGNGIGSF